MHLWLVLFVNSHIDVGWSHFLDKVVVLEEQESLIVLWSSLSSHYFLKGKEISVFLELIKMVASDCRAFHF